VPFRIPKNLISLCRSEGEKRKKGVVSWPELTFPEAPLRRQGKGGKKKKKGREEKWLVLFAKDSSFFRKRKRKKKERKGGGVLGPSLLSAAKLKEGETRKS